MFSGLGVLLLVVFAGTIGYKLIEGWGLLDSLYMTVITIATVGYHEINPFSTAGRVCTIVLILLVLAPFSTFSPAWCDTF